MIGHLKDLTRNMDGTYNLTVTVNGDCRAVWDEYREKEVDVEIKRHRQKRSLDANAYCWTIINKIAEKMRIDKAEVYRESIRAIGGTSEIVCIQDKAVESLRRGWEKHGIGWQTETMPSKIPGCTNVVLYYGSSTYDKAQMQRLTELIVNECEAQGIETRTPDELANLLSLWEGK
jgi:hypothetical protein